MRVLYDLLLSDADVVQKKLRFSNADEFCRCGNCHLMETDDENVCCKARKFIVQMPEHVCIIEHEDFKDLVKKVKDLDNVL